jgi:sedoheptulose-bisphosphatase
MSSFIKVSSIPLELKELINNDQVGLSELLDQLFLACRTIGITLRDGGYSHEKIGTSNAFGDNQLDVDVKTDAVIFSCLRDSKVVHVAASEENPLEINCNFQSSTCSKGYSVAFDPLDGSSIVDANFAVGTIVGIWQGNGLLNRIGKDQVASFVCMYGPRVTIALALNNNATKSGQAICMELTMLPNEWIISRSKFNISPKGKTFAPGNLRATVDNSGYKGLISYWIDSKYTLRYSGGLVPDVYHILIKGEGVLSNASSPAAKAKLRLLFEAAPIALIIEAAGGSSCVCPTEAAEKQDPVSLLEVVISDLDKRVGVCYGSVEEVERFKSYVF